MECMKISKRMKKLPIFIVCFSTACLLLSCIRMISSYDTATYTRLTDLKASSNIFFDKLASDTTGGIALNNEIDLIRLDIEKAFEYEKGKSKNSETVLQ